jgi:hypothetical protein
VEAAAFAGNSRPSISSSGYIVRTGASLLVFPAAVLD